MKRFIARLAGFGAAAALVAVSSAMNLGGSAGVAVAAPDNVANPPASTVATTTTAAPPTNPPTAPPTTAPPQPTTTPVPTTIATTTTLAYETTVERDCADFPGDPVLADQLAGALGAEGSDDRGSSHLVVMARACGVLFAEEARRDPELQRPLSNLELAVKDEDDRFFTSEWDAVTANPAQAELVTTASTDKWNELNGIVPSTTAAPSTSAAPTTAVDSSTAPSSTVSSTSAAALGDVEESPEGRNNTTTAMVGVVALSLGAVAWGIFGLRDRNQIPEYDGDL